MPLRGIAVQTVRFLARAVDTVPLEEALCFRLAREVRTVPVSY